MLPTRFPSRRADDAAGPEPLMPSTSRAVLSELVATAVFVFAAEGSLYGLWKMYSDTGTVGGLLAAAVALSINTSSGHVNPAVTFGVLVGRRISFARAVLYWVAQLLGSVLAALLLGLVSGGTRPMGSALGHGIHERHALLLEVVMTFGLVYTVYATAVDRNDHGGVGAIAPIAVGFVLGANILTGGPFDGAAMNPARAFGPALVGWNWRHHWVYWVGPLIGAGLAGALYEFVVGEQPDQAPSAAHGCPCPLRITELGVYEQPEISWKEFVMATRERNTFRVICC